MLIESKGIMKLQREIGGGRKKATTCVWTSEIWKLKDKFEKRE